MLSELEEIMQYKETMLGATANTVENRERRHVITKTWMKRLKGCQRDVEVWQRVLKVRALVINPRDSMDMWIKFANLCRKSGRMGLAEKTLNSLLGDEHQDLGAQASQGPPHVIYAHLKFMWAKGEREETLSYLEDFTRRLAHDLGIGSDARTAAQRPAELVQSGQLGTFTRLLARCNYKQAEWAMALQDDWGSVSSSVRLESASSLQITGYRY
jgi:FKBP12-rapamycin complex-associated protein